MTGPKKATLQTTGRIRYQNKSRQRKTCPFPPTTSRILILSPVRRGCKKASFERPDFLTSDDNVSHCGCLAPLEADSLFVLTWALPKPVASTRISWREFAISDDHETGKISMSSVLHRGLCIEILNEHRQNSRANDDQTDGGLCAPKEELETEDLRARSIFVCVSGPLFVCNPTLP